MEVAFYWRERRANQQKNTKKKKSKLYSTLESAKGEKNGEREVEGIRRPCE